MGRHTAAEAPPPPKDKPRYRFLVAISGILVLAFVTMAAVAALFPENGSRAVAGPDGSQANPFPQLPGDPAATSGATPTTGGQPPGVPASPLPTRGGPPRSTPPAKPPPPNQVSGAYSVIDNAVWDLGFQAQVAITNSTDASQSWQVRVRYPDTVTRYVASWIDGYPEPQAQQSGQTVTFTGTVTIPAGQTVSLKFRFDKAKDGDYSPTECSVNGRPCALG